MEILSNDYRIEQHFEYQGDDWWKWEIWIDASDEHLDKIDYVVYTLHSTFPNPVRQVNDRASRFKLNADGWGTFTIYARIFRKDGTEIPVQHNLFLAYPDGSENLA